VWFSMKPKKDYSNAMRVNLNFPFDYCVCCQSPLKRIYTSGRKHIISLNGIFRVVYVVVTCMNDSCNLHNIPIRAPPLSPRHHQYGFDVILRVGWLRFNRNFTLDMIRGDLEKFGINVTRWGVRKIADTYKKLVSHRPSKKSIQKMKKKEIILSIIPYKITEEDDNQKVAGGGGGGRFLWEDFSFFMIV